MSHSDDDNDRIDAPPQQNNALINNQNVNIDIYIPIRHNKFCWQRRRLRCAAMYIVVTALLTLLGLSFGLGYQIYHKGAAADICLLQHDANTCHDELSTEEDTITGTIAQFVAITPGLLAIIKLLSDSEILIEGFFLDVANLKIIKQDPGKAVGNAKDVARALAYARSVELAVITLYAVFAIVVYVLVLIEIIYYEHSNKYVKDTIISAGASIGGVAILAMAGTLLKSVYNSIRPINSEAILHT